MKHHELKCWPAFFQPTVYGRKTLEFRKNDRDYAVGDILFLREWDPVTKNYSGARLTCKVLEVHRLDSFGAVGFVAMRIEVVGP